MAGISMAVRCRITVVIVVSPFLALVSLAQQNPNPPLAWYVDGKVRGKVVSKSMFVGHWPQTPVFGHAIWITPAVARALVSASMDREKFGADVAEARLAQLLPKDCHLIWMRIDITPEGGGLAGLSKKGARSVRLLMKGEKMGLDGAIRDAPFRIIPPTQGDVISQFDFVACFPRTGPEGKPTIGSVSDDARILVELFGLRVPVRVKLKEFAATINDL